MSVTDYPDPGQIALIERSFPQLLAMRPSLAERFYQRLERDYPEIFGLFKDAEPAGQQQKLLAAMTLLVTNLNRPDLLQDYFQALGQRHRQYGVSDEMLKPFTQTWLVVVEANLTDNNTRAIVAAWQQLLDYAAALMQSSPQQSDGASDSAHDSSAEKLTAQIDELFARQQQLITDLSVTATREPGAHHLLADLAKLRLLSNELQTALDALTANSRTP